MAMGRGAATERPAGPQIADRSKGKAAAARHAIVAELLSELGDGPKGQAARAWRERLAVARRKAGRRLTAGAPRYAAERLRLAIGALDAGERLLAQLAADAQEQPQRRQGGALAR